MILGIERELSIFLQAVLAGNAVCLAYGILRIFRRLIKHNLFFVSLEDLVFWIGTGLYLFMRMYETTDGEIRWFFVAGVLLGGTGTHRILKGIIKKYIDKSDKKR